MVVSPGRRERNKTSKLERIAAAAEALFSEHSFDAVTMGEVARRAHVATGTLFMYADSKRDLVFLIANAWFEDAVVQAISVAADLPIIDQLVECFAPFYHFYAARTALAPVLLREIFFYAGRHASRSQDAIERMRGVLAERLRQAGAADADCAARICYAIYQVEVRRWVAAGGFDVVTGLRALKPLLQACLFGLIPAAAKLPPSRRHMPAP